MQRIREARLVNGTTTPYVELDRAAWSRLAASTPLPLTAEEVERLRGLADEIDLAEVREVYLPLTRCSTSTSGPPARCTRPPRRS